MSKRNQRQKASDVFRDANFVFANKVPFEEAFSEIEDVSVEVEESGEGVSWQGKRTYGKASLGEHINCSNPICYNGGVSIGSILRGLVRNKQTQAEVTKKCQGYEGSPKGKRKYRDCFNFFKIKVSVKYKGGEPISSNSQASG